MRSFYAVWVAQSLSVLGSSIASFVLTLQVYAETQSALLLSLILAVGMFGSIYMSPVAGRIADLYSKRKIAVAANMALALFAALMGAVSLAGPGRLIYLVIPLVLLSAIARATLTLTLVSSVRLMRKEANLTRINSFISLMENSTMLAPLAGAAIYAFIAPFAAFAIDAVTSLLCGLAVVLTGWNPKHKTGQPARKLSIFSGAASGFTFIFKRPGLLRLQLSFSCLNFFNGFSAAALTAYILTVSAQQGQNPELNLALTNTSASLGLLLGSLSIAAYLYKMPRHLLIAVSMLLSALVGRLLLALSALVIIWCLTQLLRNLSTQLQNTPLSAHWQETVPAEIQGSVFGARRVMGQGAYPFAVLLGGLAVSALSSLGNFEALKAVIIAGGLCELLAGTYFLLSKSIRKEFSPSSIR